MKHKERKNKITGIYIITNLLNNKVYIGQSLSIFNRWWDHKNLLNKGRHHSHHLQKAWNKYGESNFKFEVLSICNENNLNFIEDEFVKLYKANNRKFGYNILNPGNKWSIFHRERMIRIFKESNNRKIANRLSGIKKRGVGKKVIKYSLDKIKLGEYSCIKLAAESERLDKSSVAKCCKKKVNTVGNFIFRYKEDLDLSLKRDKTKRKVMSINSLGEENIYNSMIEAAIAVGCKSSSTIQAVASGRKKQCKGLKWRYL